MWVRGAGKGAVWDGCRRKLGAEALRFGTYMVGTAAALWKKGIGLSVVGWGFASC